MPKLDILAIDADEAPLEEWEAEDDVKGGPLDPRIGQSCSSKGNTVFVGHGSVRVLVRIPGCSKTVERALRSSLGDWRILPRRGISMPFFHKDLETYILVHGDDCFFFTVGRQEGREHAPSLLRSAYELSKVVTLGPLVVAVTDSEFLGQDTDVATVVNRMRARPAEGFPRLEDSGTDQC